MKTNFSIKKTALWQRIAPVWNRYQIGRLLILTMMTLFFAASLFGIINAKTAHVSSLQQSLSQTADIYDNSGEKAGSLYSQKGTYVKYDQISPSMKNAVLSIEDRNFYKEHGFSVKGLARAAVLLVKNKLTGSETISGGGSTLTQQLVKNAYLTQEQTFTRKFKEIFLSVQVEKSYSKNDILTMYLNNAWFGHGVWGVEDASEKYFGVHASELNTEQAATLAGMLTNPSGFNPIDNPGRSKDRRNLVIQTMVENKKLSKTEAKAAKATEIALHDNYTGDESYRYPWFFDSVINEAVKTYGLSEKDIMNKGYKIYTTLNQKDQENLQKDYEKGSLFGNQSNAQAATVVLNAKTGGVRAVVGGREDTHTYRGFNRANQSQLQPGSIIKPLVVYTPALVNGYSINTTLPNKKMNFGTNNYSPNNALNVETGDVKMYEALEHSYNIPAVYLLNKLGVDTGYSWGKKFGLNLTSSDKNFALALGGLTNGVSPQQMAAAYTTFANGGKMSEAHYITKIEDASGNVIVAKPKAKQTQLISKSVANKMTKMMLGTYTNGTGKGATPNGYTIAGKTGTTENPNSTNNSNSSKDSWAVAYTNDVVQVSWEGLEGNSTQSLPIGLMSTIGNLVKTSMGQILPNTQESTFQVSDANKSTSTQSTSTSNSWADNAKENITNGVNTTVAGANKVWDTVRGWFGS
ncbi:PBP1A family penicillin-binding protein [Fructobacillus sp. M1-13]|uniref:PBP1A family penicillin-binding protein n=1 Tax=Fructobacillus papyriferae TaxID=2713171 RepID=A0ABS5QNQ0_9LACO|nr:PBP1A family penicillin-binding protein [Fructobacillus papyriferae]MBS9334764.1 PBP1A family penicillin-binding protein [Fructobacillus papyriferae]MCD2158754.1 PBP1A family penicillin-binding protein [Fructobacillus papyriferae]